MPGVTVRAASSASSGAAAAQPAPRDVILQFLKDYYPDLVSKQNEGAFAASTLRGRRPKNAASKRTTSLAGTADGIGADGGGASSAGGAAPLVGRSTPEEKLRCAFDEFDVDADGKLGADEFMRILTRPGSARRLSLDEAQELIDMIDKDDDGRLSVEEYIEGWPAMGWVELPKAT